jgi:repressor LexA
VVAIMANTELTPRQQNILDFVHEFQQQHGYPPSIREIGEFFGIRSTNGVSDHLRALERKGFLSRNGHLSRSLQVVRDETRFVPEAEEQEGEDVPVIARTTTTGRTLSLASKQSAKQALQRGNGVAVPVMGRVAAGQPILAVEDSEDSLVVDSYLLGGPGEVFGLRVVGESMIEAGILPGDFLFVRKRSTAEPGDIVVAMIEGEATVKRWFPEGDRIRLQPENAAMKPIYVNRSDFRAVDLLGTVVGIYRKLV